MAGIQKLNKTFQREQILQSAEMNAITAKIDEVVDGVNVNAKKINELNISALYPTQGIDGSNRYDLAGAIAQVPAEYRVAGIKVTFVNANGDTENWEFGGGEWIESSFSEVGANKLSTLATKTELASKSDKVIVETILETTKELQPNKYYIFGEVETLTLTLAAGEENKLAEYMFEFTSGTTPTTITEIAGVEWKGDTIEADKVYQASISRGIGILIGRAKA